MKTKLFVLFFPNMLMKIKMNLFIKKNEYKNKIEFLGHNELGFQPRT